MFFPFFSCLSCFFILNVSTKTWKKKKTFFIMASFSVVKAFIFTLKKILRLPIHTHKHPKRYNKKREMNKHFHFFISAWYTRYVGCKKLFFLRKGNESVCERMRHAESMRGVQGRYLTAFPGLSFLSIQYKQFFFGCGEDYFVFECPINRTTYIMTLVEVV